MPTTIELTEQTNHERVIAVVQAGERAGYWVRLPIKGEAFLPRTDPVHLSPMATVITPDGLTFRLRSGGWKQAGKIECSVANVTQDTITVTAKGCGAAASFDRGPDEVAKNLNRRVCLNPEAIASAKQARDQLAKQVQSRKELRKHVEALKRMGYRVANRNPGADDDIRPGEYYNATMHGMKGPSIRVAADGEITFENYVRTSMANMPKLLQLID